VGSSGITKPDGQEVVLRGRGEERRERVRWRAMMTRRWMKMRREKAEEVEYIKNGKTM
jgi:hypothetical protein